MTQHIRPLHLKLQLARITALSLVLLGLFCSAQAATLLASTHPLYLIAKAVTEGIETPALLIPAEQDGHHLQLRPQDRQRIQQSDFVLWVGPSYESALTSLLKDQPNAIALTDLTAFRRVSLRDVQGRAIAGSTDPHLWLDPQNAVKIATVIATVRAIQFPAHAHQYRQNAQRFSQRMQLAVKQQQTKPQAYIAYHDAYQYLEQSLQLQLIGSLTADPELPPTANQLQWLKQNRPAGTVCVISEAPLQPAVLQHLNPIAMVHIDEVMATANDFISAWQQIARQVTWCTKA